MYLGTSKKVIFFFLLLINFIQPGKTGNLKLDNNLSSDKKLQKIFNNKKFSNLSLNKNFSETNSEIFLADLIEKQEELVIQSDKQSEINNVIYAEGNVSVLYKGKLFQADNLIYDKSNKTISAKGNIALILRDQIFKLSQLKYNFISEKGYLLDVKGFINTDNLMEDLFSNFSLTDSNKIENLL